METVGEQRNRRIKRGEIHTPKGIPWCWTFKEIASEELNYIIDIITAGHKPGEAIQDEKTNH